MWKRLKDYLREQQYQQGCRDREAGLLPRLQDAIYLDGYLKNRPEGLDGVIQYFPSIESYFKVLQNGWNQP